MSVIRSCGWLVSMGLMLTGTGAASAQSYPDRPIRIVCSQIGGINDFLARYIAQGIAAPMGQPVIIENRATLVTTEIVAKATPDGYTALVNGSNVWLAPLTRKAAYDPVRDLSPVSMLGSTPYILFVHPALPVKSVKELIAYAKAKPGELNNSVGGVGGSSHLAGELFKSMAGVKIVAVHYSSSSVEVQDLMGGRVQLAITTAPSMMPQVKVGKLRAVAVSTAKASAVAPDLPTIAASGLPGYEWGQSQALFVPAKTPVAVIKRLNHEVVRSLSTPDAKERLLTNGTEFVGSSSDELAAYIKNDIKRLTKLIKDTGIKVE